MAKKFTLEEIKEKLKIINPKIQVLGEYEKEMGKTQKRIKRYLKCRCLIHNNEWDMLMDSALQGNGCSICGRESMMNKLKLTIEEVRLRLVKINPNIEILSNMYINANKKMKFRCKICKHEWSTTWGSITRGSGCPRCGIKSRVEKSKLTIYEIKERLKIINNNIELISTEYKNNRTKLDFKCKICKHTWKTAWDHISVGNGCPNCSGHVKLDSDFIKEEIIKRGFTLFDTLKNSNKIPIATAEGYKFYTSWTTFQSMTRPSIFYPSNPFAIENINLYLKLSNSPYKLLSKEYKSSRDKLILECPIHGEFSMRLDGLISGRGCQTCSYENSLAENSSNWRGGISHLYEFLRARILEWKKESMRACGFKCVITGTEFNAIHHLYSFDLILGETMKTLNIPIYSQINQYTNVELEQIEDLFLKLHNKYGLGVCLCEEEHKLFHSTYGYGNNTPEQFEEFKQKRLVEINNQKINIKQ